MTKRLRDTAAIKLLIEAFSEEIAESASIKFLRMVRCCPNCFFFNEPMELCNCKNVNARPPARIIAFGCDEYLHKEDIPF